MQSEQKKKCIVGKKRIQSKEKRKIAEFEKRLQRAQLPAANTISEQAQ